MPAENNPRQPPRALIIADSDFRIDDAIAETVEKLGRVGYTRESIMLLSSMGSSVSCFESDIALLSKMGDFSRIEIITTTDSHGTKAVLNRLRSTDRDNSMYGMPTEVIEAIDSSMVGPFRDALRRSGRKDEDMATASIGEVDKANPEVQRIEAERLLSEFGRADVDVNVTPLNHKHLRFSGDTDNMIIVIGPTPQSNEELKAEVHSAMRHVVDSRMAYLVRVEACYQAVPSAMVAAGLFDKSQFVLMPGDKRYNDTVENFTRFLRTSMETLEGKKEIKVDFMSNGKTKVK